MAKGILNLKDYAPSVSDKVDEGRYLVKIRSVARRTSKGTSNDYLLICFNIVSGPFEGKVLVGNFMLEGGGVFRTVELFSALGISTTSESVSFDDSNWIGKPLVVDVEHRENEYQGRTTVRAEIAAIMRPTKALVQKVREEGNADDDGPAAVDHSVGEQAEDSIETEAPASEPEPEEKPEPKPAKTEETDDAGDVDLDDLLGDDL